MKSKGGERQYQNKKKKKSYFFDKIKIIIQIEGVILNCNIGKGSQFASWNQETGPTFS